MTTETLGTITDLDPETIEGLQDLLQASIDSARGFEEVASDVKDPFVKARFEERARARHAQAAGLSQLIGLNGKVPANDGSWLAAYHRTWIATKAAMTSGDVSPLLTEVIRGENYLSDRYEEVLKTTTASAAKEMLQRQHLAVLDSLKRAEREQAELKS